MQFDLPQKPAPTVAEAVARAKAIVVEGFFTDDDEWEYFGLTRYTSEADALADTNGTDIDDEIRRLKYRDDDDLVAPRTYWYRGRYVDKWGNVSAKSAPVFATFRGALDNDIDQTAPGQPGTPTLTNAPGDYDEDGTVEAGIKITTTQPESGRTPKKYLAKIWRSTTLGTSDSLDGYDLWAKVPMADTIERFAANSRFYHKAQVIPITANDVRGTPSEITSVGFKPSRADANPDAPTAIHQRNRGDRTIVYVPKTDAAFDDPRFKRVNWRVSPTVDFDHVDAEDLISDNNKLPLDDYDPGDTVYVWAQYRLRGGKVSDYFPDEGDDGHEINIATVDDGMDEWDLGTIATQDADNVAITGGSISGITDLAIADGGTGASSASAARTNLGLVIGTDVQAHDADLDAIAALVSAANKLPYATGSGTWALTDFTSFGRGLVDDADAATARSTLGLVIGTNVQAYDATLASIASLGTASDKIAYTTGVDTWAETALTSFGRSLIDDANASTARSTLGLVIGTDVQAQDAELAAIAGLTSAADKLPYFTGSGTAALADFTTTARSLLDDSSTSAMRTTLGLVIGTDVQAQDAELAAIAGLTSAADRLPYFTGSGTASLATFTTFGRSLVDDADASAGRTTLGVVIGTDVQAFDTDLAAIAALTSAANKLAYATGAGTWALTDFTSTARSLLDDTSTSAMLTTLGAAADSTAAHLAGTEVFTGLKSVSLGTATTTQDYWVLKPTDIGTGKPQLVFNKSATATKWTIGLWDNTNNAGTIDISSTIFTWNGNTLFTTANDGTGSGLDADLLDGQEGSFYRSASNINAGTLADTYLPSSMSAKLFTGLLSVSLGTATTAQDYQTWKPTDYTTGKPALNINKDATASKWNIGLWDGTNTNGTINVNCSTFSWNSVQVVDLSSSQALSNKTLQDSTTYFVDNSDATKKLRMEVSGITTATTRVVTWPDADVTITSTAATLLDDTSASAMRTTLGAAASNGAVFTSQTTMGGNLIINGVGNMAIELGRDDNVSSSPFIDFHSGSTSVDSDARISASGGSGSNFGGTINVTSAAFQWNANQIADLATSQTFSGAKVFSLPPRLPTYTVATVPSASTYSRGLIYVSDGTSNKRLAVSDGTNWRWPDGAIVS